MVSEYDVFVAAARADREASSVIGEELTDRPDPDVWSSLDRVLGSGLLMLSMCVRVGGGFAWVLFCACWSKACAWWSGRPVRTGPDGL